MAKAKRPLVRLFLFILLLVGVAMAAAPFLPLDRLKPAVESRLSALLGRPVTVGSLRLSLLGGPYLYINQLTAREDPAFGDGVFLQADEVRANLSLLGYVLRRRVELDDLRLPAPNLTFSKNSQGVWSWTSLGGNEARSASTTARPLNLMNPTTPMQGIERVVLLALAMQGVGEPLRQTVTIERASVRFLDPAATAPAETLYRNINLHVVIERQSDATSKITGRLVAQSGDGSATNGAATAAEPLQAEMPFALTVERSATLAVQGSLGPGVVQSRNFAAESFQAAIDLKDGALTLDQMQVALYDGSLTGRLQLDLATRRFTATGEAQNLNLDAALASKLQLPGQLTGHINAQYQVSGVMGAFQEIAQTLVGDGRVTSNGLFLASVNLSEQVAQALKLKQIGDMTEGTKLGALEANFRVEQGVVTTRNLQIRELDGLGDATSEEGWFKVEAAPTIGYVANVLLSNEATTQVQSASPLVGAAVSVLAVNNRIAVPVTISGEARNPQVAVDVRKFILGF